MVDVSKLDAERFLPLSVPQFHILLALVDGDCHGYGIILEIAERTGGRIRLGTGTLYTAIAGLAEDGLLGPAVERRAGDDVRRRYYRLTALGRAVLEADLARLDAQIRQARRKGLRAAPGGQGERGR
jgi:DNA-binding PadR family transcriptional regulator